MKLTKLQIEIIQYRLDVPDAMAEVLAESQKIPFEEALKLVEQHAPDLIHKLQTDQQLNPVEVEMVKDIATDECYLCCCEDAIDQPNSGMTQQRYSQIARSYNQLTEKLGA